MKTITVTELRGSFSKILDQIVSDRRPVLISHKGKVLAKMIHYLGENVPPVPNELRNGKRLGKRRK